MNDSLVIILYDHPAKHTADYAQQVGDYFENNNTILDILLKDSVSLREFIIGKNLVKIVNKVHRNRFEIIPVFLIPFRRFEKVVRANIWLFMFILRCVLGVIQIGFRYKKTYIWLFNPEHAIALQAAGSRMQSVFDCVDFHKPDSNFLWLIHRSTHVFSNSTTLFTQLKRNRSDVVHVPLGFDSDHFIQLNKNSISPFLSKRHIIGYVGGLNSRIDFALIQAVIRENPAYEFVFIGPIQQRESDENFQKLVLPSIRKLLELPNVRQVQHIAKQNLKHVLSQFAVCIIPYDVRIALNAYCFPMKSMEYFFVGKPVISTAILELQNYPGLITIASSPSQWSRALRHAVKHPNSDSIKRLQRRIALENSWEKKFTKISEYL